jgi:hypothetical protein
MADWSGFDDAIAVDGVDVEAPVAGEEAGGEEKGAEERGRSEVAVDLAEAVLEGEDEGDEDRRPEHAVAEDFGGGDGFGEEFPVEGDEAPASVGEDGVEHPEGLFGHGEAVMGAGARSLTSLSALFVLAP